MMKRVFSWSLVASICLIIGCKARSPKTTAKSIEDDDFHNIDETSLKKIDILGIPFGDTVLNEFSTARNIGPNNLSLQDDFILRFAHLAETHSRDLNKLGMETCFQFDPKSEKDTSDYRKYQSGETHLTSLSFGNSLHNNLDIAKRIAGDLWAARYCFLQRAQLPTSSKPGVTIHEPHVVALFFPNVMPIYLDGNGAWPYGQRPSDQMPGKFEALFLKIGLSENEQSEVTSKLGLGSGDCSGKNEIYNISSQGAYSASESCDVEALNRPSKGRAANSFKSWPQANPSVPSRPVIPLNPPVHRYQNVATKEWLDGFKEDRREDFPFLWPPNEGNGYYQVGQGDDKGTVLTTSLTDYAEKGKSESYNIHKEAGGIISSKACENKTSNKAGRDECMIRARDRTGSTGVNWENYSESGWAKDFDSLPAERKSGLVYTAACIKALNSICKHGTRDEDLVDNSVYKHFSARGE